jgi:hypothetical protein
MYSTDGEAWSWLVAELGKTIPNFWILTSHNNSNN